MKVLILLLVVALGFAAVRDVKISTLEANKGRFHHDLETATQDWDESMEFLHQIYDNVLRRDEEKMARMDQERLTSTFTKIEEPTTTPDDVIVTNIRREEPISTNMSKVCSSVGYEAIIYGNLVCTLPCVHISSPRITALVNNVWR